MFKPFAIAGLLAVTTAAATSVVAAVEDDEREIPSMEGSWTGTGFVQKDETSKPMKVRCSVEGLHAGNEIGFEGVCRAMMIFRRPIGAKLIQEGDRLTGTYTGSDLGVADLDGALEEGRTAVLTMTFPREIHGDAEAMMTIHRPKDSEFTITTTDIMSSGEELTTSQITFARK
ncbi:MAG: hypothetical protein ROR55_05025 [Devosia sp.]